MKEFIEKFKKVIEGQEGTVSLVDEWGMRDLAYRIDKQSKGVYALLRYQATGRAVEELERNLSLLSPYTVKDKYKQLADRIRFLDLPTPRVIQELVTTWKVLWRWRK